MPIPPLQDGKSVVFREIGVGTGLGKFVLVQGGRGKAQRAPERTGARPIGLCPGHPLRKTLKGVLESGHSPPYDFRQKEGVYDS